MMDQKDEYKIWLFIFFFILFRQQEAYREGMLVRGLAEGDGVSIIVI